MNRAVSFSSILILFMCINLSKAQLSGDTFASASTSKSANWVLTYSEAPGFASKNTKGEISGVCVDIMKEFKKYVEKEHGISVNITFESKNANDFTEFLETVKNSEGGVFGLSNTTITEARKSDYNFSPPYITNIGMILSNNNVPTLVDLPNIAQKFKGMTAVTVKNTTNENQILNIKKQYFPTLKIEYVPSFAQAMQIIAKDSKKFANVDFTYYFEAIQNRKPIKRHPGGDDKTEQFGIIMPKSNDWSPLLEEFMSSGFLQSAEYKQIISANLGQAAMKFFESLK
ncbi:substrate-binding periplasmic protein [Fulvivirga lutea]|uniref:Transporter substrate-binding domain-containing protein n=1 Tax=Fulvivirga lutea TaxID=2810512 RepID=A0A974WMS8_9BACT|nr:transporter substrate-binding domain-containing protein [Fulvivirga lutea]QSE98328.1 transporter substrate-binding domain-containing protein [Fulvivirga lutea]